MPSKTQTSIRMDEKTLLFARQKAQDKKTTMSNIIRSALNLYYMVDELPKTQRLAFLDARDGQVVQVVRLSE